MNCSSHTYLILIAVPQSFPRCPTPGVHPPRPLGKTRSSMTWRGGKREWYSGIGLLLSVTTCTTPDPTTAATPTTAAAPSTVAVAGMLPREVVSRGFRDFSVGAAYLKILI